MSSSHLCISVVDFLLLGERVEMGSHYDHRIALKSYHVAQAGPL